jgi:hypothetical protein
MLAAAVEVKMVVVLLLLLLKSEICMLSCCKQCA